ncbi:hypothetical protein ACFOGJ_19115 [Marinibaculum pumilum]|uniref:Uncharacterized protein n=1 Tax=Marinibaculum pumilum TaxID=1766165 RepID=A0ABV7L3Y1_9PROT
MADAIPLLEAHETRQRRRKAGHDQETFGATVAAVLCDVVHHHLTGRDGAVAIPRSSTKLGTKSRYRHRVLSKQLPQILDAMAKPEVGLIRQEVGRRGLFGFQGWETTIQAGPRLRQHIRVLDLDKTDLKLAAEGEVIILRRDEDDSPEGHDSPGQDADMGATKAHGRKTRKVVVEYEDTSDTNAMRARMETINEWLWQADLDVYEALVGHHEVDPEERRLRRIFSLRRFDRGGRLYGGFWQTMKKEARRKAITINGEPVVELDLGQVAPRILYGMVGARPHWKDAYIVPGHEWHREGIKLLLNTILFDTKPRTQMPQGGRKLFSMSDHANDKTSHKQLREKEKVETIIQAIGDHHHPIRHQFFTGVGHEVQYRESEIMVEILLRLRENDVVALPIHDGLLVPRSALEVSREVMVGTFEEMAQVEAVVRMKGWTTH